MTLIVAVFLLISFAGCFHSDFKYSSAIAFSVTLICATLLVMNGFIE